MSGAVAGRMRFLAYVVLSSVCTTNLVYPVAVHWVWSDQGWLLKWLFVDFAGAGVVHLVGGTAAAPEASARADEGAFPRRAPTRARVLDARR